MIQALLHARKKLFGTSTEATKQIEGQLFLFEEAQKLAEKLGVEQKKSRSSLTLEHCGNLGVGQRCLRGCKKRWKNT